MKDKRQGNDLKVAWSIFMQDGEPFRLDGKDVSLYLKNMFGRKELNDFVTTGNIIQWTFYGKDQKNSGKYSLELVINEGEKGMITTDKCDFVNLVSCSCKLQGGEDAPNVETESIELTSTLEYVAGGGEYDDTALWRALDGKVDKEEGLGLSEENYTAEDKEKLAGLENYDDSGIKDELAKKIESEVVVDTESTEDFEFGYDDTGIRQEIAELSAEVGNKQDTITDLETIRSGAAKGATALQSVPDTYATKTYVDDAIKDIPAPTPSASNEWKCVFDGRMEVGANEWVFSTYADGTPLKAEEVVVQVIMDNDTTKTTQGYVRVQSSTNKDETYYGAFFIENPNNNGFIAMSQVRLKASPFIMVAEMYDNLQLKVAQGVNCVGRLGKDVCQIYEDITLVRISATTKIAEAAPLLKIYAR